MSIGLPGFTSKHPPAVLALADGSIFPGIAVGVLGQAVGEVVFNTSMTGYQEILTDPSYAEQIVTLTYPHIGNVGMNPEDAESDRIQAKGLIIRELSPTISNWRAQQSLEHVLKQQNMVAIAGVDTRRLTRLLREKGAQNGCILTGGKDPREAIKLAQAYPGLVGVDLAKVVCTPKITPWTEPSLDLNDPKRKPPHPTFHVVVYDFGVKRQICRLLVDRGCRLTLVPAQTPAKEVIAMQPDGVLLSNGPGDPAACDYAIENIKALLAQDIPLYGICLGFQLLALACGAKTVKMKFGHHGANHPVEDVVSKRVYITSQNHSFAVDDTKLPDTLRVTHRSLFDGSLQGILHTQKRAFAFQGHPEACPGPQDITDLFDRFIAFMSREKNPCQNDKTLKAS